MKCVLWAVIVFFTLSGCLEKKQNMSMDLINDLIKSREENRIIDHKRVLYSLDLNAFTEPYRTMLLMEKKYYFHDTTPFHPDHQYFQYMFDGIRQLERSENKVALMKVDTFFQKLDTTQAIYNAFLLPIVYEKMETLRIKPEITNRLYNVSHYDKKDMINRLADAYAQLLQQEILYNDAEYNKACALGQRSISKLLTSKEYPKLTAQMAYHTLKSKIDSSDTINIMYYYYVTQNMAASNRTKLLSKAKLLNNEATSEYFKKIMIEMVAKGLVNEECELLSLMGAKVSDNYWNGEVSISELDFYELYIYNDNFQKIHQNTPEEIKINLLLELINWQPKAKITTDERSKFFLEKECIIALELLCSAGNNRACQLTLEGI